MSFPMLFLDVDGVLNPFGTGCPAGFTDHHLFPRTWSQGRQVPTMLITAEPTVGLTRAAVRQALAWARGLCR